MLIQRRGNYNILTLNKNFLLRARAGLFVPDVVRELLSKPDAQRHRTARFIISHQQDGSTISFDDLPLEFHFEPPSSA